MSIVPKFMVQDAEGARGEAEFPGDSILRRDLYAHIHILFLRHPPQLSLAAHPFMLVLERPASSLRRPHQVVPTIPDGVTASPRHSLQ